jgi:hypothetical protein
MIIAAGHLPLQGRAGSLLLPIAARFASISGPDKELI